ncbi:hypothetical protein [Streptomyces silvisoli]|uniref:MFS transporter n=1 Tax=Streptomyces silvisoli TaxID=3034235 RepID=A0ABT5ZVS2_9ACTN|nr:hypothetical protein [Streptomyces silvisoli]MDF3293928.1 hypothetical protein [Streptomyces silvisoli]
MTSRLGSLFQQLPCSSDALLLAGVIRDTTGSYTTFWLGVGTLCGLAAALCVTIRLPHGAPATAQ